MSEFTETFEPGDLIYGFREDIALYVDYIKDLYPQIKYFSQSHINKSITYPSDDHLCLLIDPKLSLKQKIFAGYGTCGSSVRSRTSPEYVDINRPAEFYEYLKNHYKKHTLFVETYACNFFKRLCKQGIFAAVANENKIHFIADSFYNSHISHQAIVEKGGRSKKHYCKTCDLDSVTGSELRSIFRNWGELKGKVLFWDKGKKADPPWVKEPMLWLRYKPKSYNTTVNETIPLIRKP